METAAVLRLMQDVAERVINPRFRALTDGEVHEKNPGDLVTIADHESEELLTEALEGAYPGVVVLGEEAFATDPTLLDRYRAADHAFTVDPVDGTKNFVHGSPDHAVMLSESRAGVVTRAWIWQPQHEAAYVAERGHGASRNGVPLRRRRADPDASTWRALTSRRASLGKRLGPTAPLELSWVCCGVDYPQLIEGAADVLLYGGTRPWDHAPGKLLLEEAGGYLGTFDGDPYLPSADSPRGLIAAADEATYDRAVGWLTAGLS